MQELITSAEWLANWQANRRLTRKVIEAFPEKELFEFSIGGMRPFAEMVGELLYIADLTIKQVIDNEIIPFGGHSGYAGKSKSEILSNWDKTTELIDKHWNEISQERFREKFNLFGMFDYSIIENFSYLYQNEIHHRGQGYVYLRALGIEPPVFYGEF